jgi:hypothetical protein
MSDAPSPNAAAFRMPPMMGMPAGGPQNAPGGGSPPPPPQSSPPPSRPAQKAPKGDSAPRQGISLMWYGGVALVLLVAGVAFLSRTESQAAPPSSYSGLVAKAAAIRHQLTVDHRLLHKIAVRDRKLRIRLQSINHRLAVIRSHQVAQ